jgi:hypothetical protein
MADKKNNTGIENTGDWNSGNWNSGYGNSGNKNSGYGNSGDRNSGNRNSGYGNSGDRNSGYGNSGDRNSGYGNSGDRNSGNWNSGDWNSGYGNSTNRSAGIFNSKEGTVRMFNKETNLTWDEIDHPYFDEFHLTKWIPEEEMTEGEKIAEPEFYVRKGYLKTYSWEEAWANFWRDTDEENRQKFLNLPNFDAEVFKEITGIDVTKSDIDDKTEEAIGLLRAKGYKIIKN